MEPSKKDWLLYREKIAGWQEAYMEKLIKEYVDYLNGDDKVSPGVSIELRKKDMVFDLVRLINERVITFDDLEEFSDELREYVEFIQQRLSY